LAERTRNGGSGGAEVACGVQVEMVVVIVVRSNVCSFSLREFA
jgi:hypothetical protein